MVIITTIASILIGVVIIGTLVCRFNEWFWKSVQDHFPHYLTALFTLGLALFASFAYIESHRSTEALEGQLKAMKADERPFLWVSDVTQPTLLTTPAEYSGQIRWHVFFENYGKGVAYHVFAKKYIRLGDQAYQPSYQFPHEPALSEETGAIPPTKSDYSTAFSNPGFTQTYLDKLLSQDHGLGILIEFTYSGDSTGKDKYSDTVCMERESSGAWGYRDPNSCKR